MLKLFVLQFCIIELNQNNVKTYKAWQKCQIKLKENQPTATTEKTAGLPKVLRLK